MKLSLVRFSDNGDATCGALLLCGAFFCLTLEDTGKITRAGVFKIPPGTYTAKRTVSEKFGECFTIEGVAGHDLLRMHWGNDAEDTEGCVLLGEALDMSKKPYIWHSRDAFKMFMDAMVGVDECPIEIKEVYA